MRKTVSTTGRSKAAEVAYVHLRPGDPMPPCPLPGPFAAVVIIEAEVADAWRNLLSEWLVQKGCLSMMAWGRDCVLWDDSVDWANLAMFDFEDIPESHFVRTTWHERDTLEDVLWQSQYVATHDYMPDQRVILIDIGERARSREILALFAQAEDLAERESRIS